MSGKFIVAGIVADDNVEEWLRIHGAKVEHCMGLTIAQLPAKAHVYQELGATRWHVTVGFSDSSGNDEDTYLDIETAEEDASQTTWRLVTE